MKINNIIILVLITLFAISCDNQNSKIEKVNLPFVVRNFQDLNHYSRLNLSQLQELQNANFALITYFKIDNVVNSLKLEPKISSAAVAIIDDMFDVKNVYFGSDTLTVTSPLIYPGYFYNGKNWNSSKYTFKTLADWKIQMNNNTYLASSRFQYTLYPMSIAANDTIRLNEAMNLYWPSEQNNTNKIYISFTWYPSYNDANYFKDYPGFATDDNGSYTILPSVFSAYDIPQYGVLQVNVSKYNCISEQILDKKVCIINTTESSTSVYIGKNK